MGDQGWLHWLWSQGVVAKASSELKRPELPPQLNKPQLPAQEPKKLFTETPVEPSIASPSKCVQRSLSAPTLQEHGSSLTCTRLLRGHCV